MLLQRRITTPLSENNNDDAAAWNFDAQCGHRPEALGRPCVGGTWRISSPSKETTSANPDLVKRIRLDASLNEQRPEGYYGSFPVGYTDGPFLKPRAAEVASNTGTEQTYA